MEAGVEKGVVGPVPGRRVPVHESPEVHAFLAADASQQAALLERWGLGRAVALMMVNACENRCFFCANPGTIAVPPELVTRWDHLARHLAGRPADTVRLLIGGNEPALHPDFDRVMETAWELGYREVELMTSGLQLGGARLAPWVAHGLRGVAVPIYGATAAPHDEVCGTVCFDRLVAGLDAAHAAGVRIWLHTLALRRTVDGLGELAAWAWDRWQAPVAVAPLREKDGQFRYDTETVPLSELQARLPGLPPSLHLVGMPACLDRGRARGSATVIEMYFRTQLRAWDPSCAACADRPTCAGVVAAQLQRWGADGLAPRAV
jgi:hypothetical protein